jgi:hypothetical protein
LETYLLVDVVDQFYALSYVWGIEEFTKSIICNGRFLKITRSLNNILRDLYASQGNFHEVATTSDTSDAHPAESNEAKILLWIDAICIDQSNPEEVASHIPLMGSIYSATGATLAYVAPFNHRNVSALKRCQEVLRTITKATSLCASQTLIIDEAPFQVKLKRYPHVFWDYLYELALEPWF